MMAINALLLDERTRSLLPAGEVLRDWRHRRHLTQQGLASAAGVSLRLLAALEAGRTLPNRDVMLRLTERLDVPLRDRNAMLAAAGHAPAFPARPLHHPDLAATRRMLEDAVAGCMPNPALALDRHWTVLTANGVLKDMIAGVDPMLRTEPVNWARLALHPAGLAPRIANLRDWHGHVMTCLRQDIEATGDPVLAELQEEIRDYPMPAASAAAGESNAAATPFRLMTVEGALSFYTATTQFRSAIDVTLSELRIQTFYPVDAATARLMRQTAARITARRATAG